MSNDNNKDSQKIAEALLLKMHQMDRTQYASIAELYADIENPLYTTSDVFRETVEARLAASTHLLKDTPHLVSDFRGSDAVSAHFKTDKSGNVVMTAIGSPSEIGRGDSVQTKEADPDHEPEFVNTGSSVILNFSTEGSFGEGNGE